MAFTPVSHVHFSPGACLCLFVVVCLCVCVQPWFYLLESRGVFSFSKRCTEESEFGPRSLLPSSLLLSLLLFVAVLCVSLRLVGCWLVMSNLCCVTVVVVLFVELVITWPFLHDGQEVVSAMKRLFFIMAHVAKQELQPGFISARLSNSRADGLTKRLLSCSPGLSIATANI